MKKLLSYLRKNPDVAISLPAALCFIQFITDIIDVVKTGEFKAAMLMQMVSSANGFEAVCLCIIMIALSNKNQ